MNHVKRLYEPFTDEEISKKIVELLIPEGMTAPVEIIFQKIEALHRLVKKIKETGILPEIIQRQAETKLSIGPL